jgi:hypothetical protein
MKRSILGVLMGAALLGTMALAGETALPVKLEYAPEPILGLRSPVFEPFSVPSFKQDTPPPTQKWSGAWIVQVTGREEDRAAGGVVTEITPLTVRGRKINLTLDGFAGVSFKNAIPVLAALLGVGFAPLDQISLKLHAGVTYRQGETNPAGFCLGASLNVRF